MRRLALAAALVMLLASPAGAEPGGPMRYVYNAPESARDTRYEYHWKILATALEKTKATWGPYVMEPSVTMTEKRQAYELRNATGKLTVMYLSTTPEFERDLVPVRIPVDRNLGGYCVFLIRREDRPRFAGIERVDQLARLNFGLGLGWVDVDILRANDLRVVTGSNYDGLFEMLVNRRFDVFLRAAVEVLDEFEQRKAEMPSLAIEDSLVLYYPLPMYFWFPKTAEGERLAARVREGMLAMIEDGTYDRIFSEYQDWKIKALRLNERRILRIANPNVGPETPLADERLWFDPATYRSAAP